MPTESPPGLTYFAGRERANSGKHGLRGVLAWLQKSQRFVVTLGRAICVSFQLSHTYEFGPNWPDTVRSTSQSHYTVRVDFPRCAIAAT
ncbi:hypothetical protein J2X56_005369 [Herbaspirillum sp. 1173]|nr:hypothetical protein [Herbaspirillum sp. 1173]